MSNQEHDALDALRRLDDGSFELADGVEERIEAEMLARFDEVAGSAPTLEPSTVVTLEPARRRVVRSRSSVVRAAAKGVAAAAALVAVVAGLVVALDRDEPTSNPPSMATDPPASREVVLAEQLDAFCTTYLTQARVADDGWSPSGQGSEARGNVIISVEQAADAMVRLDQPLGGRLADLSVRLVDAATEARLATSLRRSDADESVMVALDLLESAPVVAGVSPLPASCLP